MLKIRNGNKKFFDRLYSGYLNLSSLDKCADRLRKPFYKALSTSIGFYKESVLKNDVNCDYLEIGIGTEKLHTKLGSRGSRVLAIDISEEAVNNALKEVYGKKLSGNVTIKCQDAENIDISDNTFDVVYGKWILHHLSLSKAIGEIKRLLKPDGTAIFIEPLGTNPLLNLFRKLSPSLRVKDEHPLTLKDLTYIKESFKHYEFKYYHLLFFLAPFLPITTVDKLECFVLKKTPFLSPLSWEVVIILKDPKKLKD